MTNEMNTDDPKTIEHDPSQIITNPEQLRPLSMRQLIEMFNNGAEYLKRAQIVRFSDHATAVKRTAALMVEVKAVMTGASTRDAQNEFSEEAQDVSKPAPKTKAPKVTKAKKVAKTKAPKMERQATAKSSAQVWPVYEVNPRRVGSHGHKSYAVALRNPGITVSAFVEKGGRQVDLNWDLKHGNLSLEKVTAKGIAPGK